MSSSNIYAKRDVNFGLLGLVCLRSLLVQEDGRHQLRASLPSLSLDSEMKKSNPEQLAETKCNGRTFVFLGNSSSAISGPGRWHKIAHPCHLFSGLMLSHSIPCARSVLLSCVFGSWMMTLQGLSTLKRRSFWVENDRYKGAYQKQKRTNKKWLKKTSEQCLVQHGVWNSWSSCVQCLTLPKASQRERQLLSQRNVKHEVQGTPLFTSKCCITAEWVLNVPSHFEFAFELQINPQEQGLLSIFSPPAQWLLKAAVDGDTPRNTQHCPCHQPLSITASDKGVIFLQALFNKERKSWQIEGFKRRISQKMATGKNIVHWWTQVRAGQQLPLFAARAHRRTTFSHFRSTF